MFSPALVFVISLLFIFHLMPFTFFSCLICFLVLKHCDSYKANKQITCLVIECILFNFLPCCFSSLQSLFISQGYQSSNDCLSAPNLTFIDFSMEMELDPVNICLLTTDLCQQKAVHGERGFWFLFLCDYGFSNIWLLQCGQLSCGKASGTQVGSLQPGFFCKVDSF